MKKAMVYGAGLSGLGAENLLKEIGYEVLLVDDKKAMSSEEALKYLEGISLFIKSPGIPYTKLVKEADKAGIEIIDELELAYREVSKEKTPPKLIAVTGTNGKTTVTTKIKEMLQFAGKRCEYAGNIGKSFAQLTLDIKDGRVLDYIVLEMSSYQLENLKEFRADISMVINLAPDHLDRYNSAKEYYDTKLNIAMNQTIGDIFILNIDSSEIIKRLSRISANKFIVSKNNSAADIHCSNGRVVSEEGIIAEAEKFALKGEHNLENMLFILAVGRLTGVTDEVMREFLYNTNSLEHRMEEFLRVDNTLFVNDSKGTNIESTLMAVEAYKDPIVVCGGVDKKLDLEPLIEGLKDRCKGIYLIGEIGDGLEEQLTEAGYPAEKIYNGKTLERVVEKMAEQVDVSEKQVILLSPATASFDQFKNYLERGNTFKRLIIEHFEKGEKE